MAYTVRLKPRAERDLDRLSLSVARRIWQRLLNLEEEPRPHGAMKLVGAESYRIRIRDYRIVYTVDDRKGIVDIVRVAHRREVYR